MGVLKKNIPDRLALLGRSPGVACAMEKSRRDDWKKLRRHGSGFGTRIANILIWKYLGWPQGNFQSSLRDFSSLES